MKNTHVGFNLLWMFRYDEGQAAAEPDYKLLDFLAEEGFNFLRIPMNYWYWIKDFDYTHPDEKILNLVNRYVEAAVERGFHLSLNIHKAPGYCINGTEKEKHNLWKDEIAQNAFRGMWKDFSERLSGYSGDELSFDLLNEPPNVGDYGMTRDNHKKLMLSVIDTIRSVSPNRPITLDGLGGGNIAMPELADTGTIHSTRGYQPMSVTHYKAAWNNETRNIPEPVYPGTEYGGKIWNRETILEHYKPWVDVSKSGVPVHVGEMGCYTQIPNDMALRWFNDLFSVFLELKWGFGLWEFDGDFGVVNHGRPGTRWENKKGYKLDIELWNLIIQTRDELRRGAIS